MRIAQKKLAIKAGKLIDGTGRPPLSNSIVLIEGSTILKVASAEETTIPDDAKVVDANAMVTMPGLINMHEHLTMTSDVKERERIKAASRPPLLLLFHAAKRARDCLKYGFTTVRDCGPLHCGMGPSTTGLVSLKKAIDFHMIPGARLVVCGVVTMTSGHMDLSDSPLDCTRSVDQSADGIWEVRRQVRSFIREQVDFIKTSSSGGIGGMIEQVWWRNYTFDELQAIVDESHSVGKRVAVHAYTAPTVKAAVKAGVDTVEHGSMLDDDAVDLMVKSGVTYVPTLAAFSGEQMELERLAGTPEEKLTRLQEIQREGPESFKKAYMAGVKIATGTDGPPPMYFASELELMVSCGMSEMEAIVASTRSGAEALGMGKILGTVEPGKLADLVIVRDDPLRDIKVLRDPRNVEMTVKEGQIVYEEGRILQP